MGHESFRVDIDSTNSRAERRKRCVCVQISFYTLLLPEGQEGETSEVFGKQSSFGSRRAMDRKYFHFFQMLKVGKSHFCHNVLITVWNTFLYSIEITLQAVIPISIVTRIQAGRCEVRLSDGTKYVFFIISKTYRPTPKTTLTPTECVPSVLSPGEIGRC